MKHEIGKQYGPDDLFKAKARLHQSKYRANILQVDYDEFGNRLTENDAKNLLNYYSGLNVRDILRRRYPPYSKTRDSDMLRSEHIPFNLFAPLISNPSLAKTLVEKALSVPSKAVQKILFEYAPEPKDKYLNDKTAFDVYIEYLNRKGETSGIGIEVKYTEKEYKIGPIEKARVDDEQSTYWKATRRSGMFIDDTNKTLAADSVRQIWRNHILGLSMVQQDEIKDFISITLFPSGNTHFQYAIPQYQNLLKKDYRHLVRGCTFEHFIDKITGDKEIVHWKSYLAQRYLVSI